jgi:hypothetical protein
MNDTRWMSQLILFRGDRREYVLEKRSDDTTGDA